MNRIRKLYVFSFIGSIAKSRIRFLYKRGQKQIFISSTYFSILGIIRICVFGIIKIILSIFKY